MDIAKMNHVDKWTRFFELALERHRQEHPGDDSTDTAILFSMIEYFVKEGIAGIDSNGKYTLPEIVNQEELFRRLASHRN